MEKTVTVIMMTGSECNLNCRYCYVMGSRQSVGKFNEQDIVTLVENCSYGFDNVEFCWHGGEPLLSGIDFYEKVVNAQKNKQWKQGTIFQNNIQSNGVLINEEWLDFLKKNGFHLGLSFDAPPDVNIIHRRLEGELLLEKFKKIREHSLPLGLLCVVSALNVRRGKEIFEFFKDIGVSSYSFLPLRELPSLPDCPPCPSNDDLFELYRITFELWAGMENCITSIEPIDSIVGSLLNGHPKQCSFANGCLKRMITIDQEGNIIPCGSLVSPEFILGNILNEKLLAVLSKEKTKEFRRLRNTAIERQCRECDFISICRGGCRADAYWYSGSYDGKYQYCGARKKLFKYVRGRLNNILSKSLRETG